MNDNACGKLLAAQTAHGLRANQPNSNGGSVMSRGSVRSFLAVALGVAGMATAPFASAQNFYIGGGAGYAYGNIADIEVTGATVTQQAKDNHAWGWKAFAGWQFNRFLAVEGGYINLDKFSTQLSTTAGNASIDITNEAYYVDVLGIIPIGRVFAVFGKLGGTYGISKTDSATTGTLTVNAPGKSEAFGVKAGLGVQVNLGENFAIRAEYEFYPDVGGSDSNGGDVNYFGASAIGKF
jgi:OOP family OmpA-OmpF porin